jgi:phosphonoacetate hydrolase
MMNDPSYLRCHTILAAFAAAGARVAVVSAKDKLRSLLGHALPLANGNSVCFSAEKADEADLQKNGIEEALALVGKPLPPVYSAELSEFVFAAGVQLIKSDHWDLLYLSSTDFIQHQFAPGTPAANSFYSMLDGYLSQLDALGVTLAITADHGMKPKHDAEGRPNVIYLQQMLDEWLGGGEAKVILPITDPYVVHHGALGSFALIYLASDQDADRIVERLAGTEGILEVLPRPAGCARFGLPPDREGDLIVISTAEQTFGTRPEHHDLGQLKTPLRSHGGITEQRVPMLLNRRCQTIDPSVKLRNFDAFSLALNSV